MLEIKESEILKNKYQILIENIDGYSWIYDFYKGKFIYITPSVTKFKKFTIEEAAKESLDYTFFLENKQSFTALIEKRVKKLLKGNTREETSSTTYEAKQYDRFKRIVEVEVFTKIIYEEETDSIYVLGRTSDISKRKELEVQLEKEIKYKNEIIQKLIMYEEQVSQVLNELNEKNEMLRNLANTDELTGIYNRHYFDKIIIGELERNNRYNERLSLILFDVDHFKRVNDTWGHSVGDDVLVSITKNIKENIRKPDVLVRWGGEEFTILLPQTNLEGAINVANKLRGLVENIEHPQAGRVTASFAVAERLKGEDFENWFERLDNALYKAKDSGRNCVITAEKVFMKIKWKKEWESGNIILDRQHKHIYHMANELLEAALLKLDSKDTGEKLHIFVRHMKYHLKYEERILRGVDYVNILEHIEEHNKLIAKIDNLVSRYENNEIKIMDFLNFLLEDSGLNYMIKEDILFFNIINSITN